MEDLAVSLPIGSSNLRIDELISSRCNELDIGPVELVRRCGYKNLAKGLRRLEALHGGELKSTRGLIRGLPQALDLPAEVIQKAIDDTTKQLHEAHEAAWRAAFKPHAIILTDRKIPQPIFVAAIIGVDELLRIDFPPAASPETYGNLHDRKDRLKQCLMRARSSAKIDGRRVAVSSYRGTYKSTLRCTFNTGWTYGA
jgi:hypothetical protein